jgi:uncharacterized membrane protein YdjX (TVP38/TMEM64 family)
MKRLSVKTLAIALSMMNTKRYVGAFIVRNVALPIVLTSTTRREMQQQQKRVYENIVPKSSTTTLNKKDTMLKTTAFEFGIDDTPSKLQQSTTDIPLKSQSQIQDAFLLVAALGVILLASTQSIIQDTIYPFFQTVWKDPTSVLESAVDQVQAMGPAGAVYFGLMYTIAEVLAIPAVPLTASAGYLFGVSRGTAIVLMSASVAAAISFIIGRTILRSYVVKILEDYPDFQKLDRAIEKEGFKLMVLLRMSPVFPFALSNYLYGASSVGFWPFFWGTIIGFAPGTIAYVYSGQVGKVLTLGDGNIQPWYVYFGGFVVLAGFLKILADAATGILEGLEDDDAKIV